MSTISLAPAPTRIRGPELGAGRSTQSVRRERFARSTQSVRPLRSRRAQTLPAPYEPEQVRPAGRRPAGVRPPRVSFVEAVAHGCRVEPLALPAPQQLLGQWHLTSRGVAVVVTSTAAAMSLAVVAMVFRFLAVTAG